MDDLITQRRLTFKNELHNLFVCALVPLFFLLQWLQPWRFPNPLNFEVVPAYAKNFFQEWYETTMPEYWTKTKHILIFGSTGTGKSTLVNHITGSNLTTSNRATGVTLSSTEESKRHNDVDYRIIDTAGLNEGINGTVKHIDALTNLVRLLNKTEGGLNLMVMVTKGKIVQTTIENYRLFVEVMTSNKVPTIIVQTNLDDEVNPCDWVKKNWGAFKDQNLNALEVVGTAFPQHKPWHTHNGQWAGQTCQESTERVWTAIERCSSEAPISYLADRAGLVVSLRKAWNVFARRLGKQYVWVSHEMVTVIKNAAHLSEKQAKSLAQEAEVCRS